MLKRRAGPVNQGPLEQGSAVAAERGPDRSRSLRRGILPKGDLAWRQLGIRTHSLLLTPSHHLLAKHSRKQRAGSSGKASWDTGQGDRAGCREGLEAQRRRCSTGLEPGALS